MKTSTKFSVSLGLFLFTVGFSLVSTNSCTSKVEISDTFLTAGPGGTYQAPPVRTFPSNPSVIQKWIDDTDLSMIRQHGWDIWESITTNTGNPDNLPVWETWYSGHELFEMGVKSKNQRAEFRDFEFPKQSTHFSNLNDIPTDPKERPTSFNRYSRSLAEVIWDKGYNKLSTLNSIKASFDKNNTPTDKRDIITSIDSTDDQSFSLKPVFQFISGDEPTALPYWAGVSPMTTDDLTNPEPHTWRQCVVIDPTGKLKPGDTHRMKCNNVVDDWNVVDINSIYNIKFTQEEVDNFSRFALVNNDDVGANSQTDSASISEMVKVGNYALLMAMHVTGKEIVNWTWQTFYWSPKPVSSPYGKDRPVTIANPWSNYDMKTAYFMVYPPKDPRGEPHIAYNPYLETNLHGNFISSNNDTIPWFGVFSNCMSCHRMAAIDGGQYTSGGFISKSNESLFKKAVRTDFLWSIPVRAN